MPLQQRPPPRDVLAVSLAAALGGGFTEVVYLYLLLITREGQHGRANWVSLAGIAVLMLLALLHYIDPLIDHLRILFGLSAHPAVQRPGRPWLRSLAIGFLGMLTLYLHEVFSYMTEHQRWAVALVLGGALLSFGLVTYAWIRGARQQPPRAAKLGALAAAMTEGTLKSMLFVVMHFFFLISIPLGIAIRESIAGAVTWSIIGLAGGLAIDRRWGARRSRGVAVSIVAMGVLFTLIGWGVFHHELKDALSNVVDTGGWGLGLVLHPQSDALLAVGSGNDSHVKSGPSHAPH
jgi:hypothetical protein